MHCYEKLLEIGVTKVKENWCGTMRLELILDGDFDGKSASKILFENMPACIWCVGETKYIFEDKSGMLREYGFTRGSDEQV